MDETHPYLTLNAPENNSLKNSKQTQVSLSGTDQYFDRLGFSFNGSDTTWTSNQDTSFYVNSQEGDNELLAIAEDKAGNQTLEKRFYTVDSNYVSIEDDFCIPLNFQLYQNYPNPFNPTTTIQFDIPLNPPSKGDNIVETLHATSLLQLNVYDITGKEIATLVDNINTSGSYQVEWNASGYPSGIYFYQLQSNSEIIATKKMLLMK